MGCDAAMTPLNWFSQDGCQGLAHVFQGADGDVDLVFVIAGQAFGVFQAVDAVPFDHARVLETPARVSRALAVARFGRAGGIGAHGVMAVGCGENQGQRRLGRAVVDGGDSARGGVQGPEVVELRRHVTGEGFNDAAGVAVFFGQGHGHFVIENVGQAFAADDDALAQAVVGQDSLVAGGFAFGFFARLQPEGGPAEGLQAVPGGAEFQYLTGGFQAAIVVARTAFGGVEGLGVGRIDARVAVPGGLQFASVIPGVDELPAVPLQGIDGPAHARTGADDNFRISEGRADDAVAAWRRFVGGAGGEGGKERNRSGHGGGQVLEEHGVKLRAKG